MTLTKFYTENKFGLLIDLRSMPDHALHGTSKRLVNSTGVVQLELELNASNVSCNVFVISDSQIKSVEY